MDKETINTLVFNSQIVTILNNFIVYKDGLHFKAMKRTLNSPIKSKNRIITDMDKLIYNVLSPDKVSVLFFVKEDAESLIDMVKNYDGTLKEKINLAAI